MQHISFNRSSGTVDIPDPYGGPAWQFSGLPDWVFTYLERGKASKIIDRLNRGS